MISFDGVRLSDSDPIELRHRIALVPQDVVIFAATVRENIRFGRPEASDADVTKAAELALTLSAVAFAALAVWLFTRGLRHYGHTGSTRYLDYGHRR